MFSSGKVPPVSLPGFALEGQRIEVRPPRLEDWGQWAAVRKKNQDILRPLEPVWPTGCFSKEHFRKRLTRQAINWKTDSAYAFLIFLKENDSLIGGINLNHVCREAAQFASVGYWLDHDHQGQGYMTEALRLVVQHAFKKLKLHRINAGCLPDNQRSVNLLRKIGFREEGYAEKYLEIGGKWQDHILFGLNIEDWPGA